MSTIRTTRLLVALVATAAVSGGRASALEWTARAGALYQRQDVTTPVDRTTVPHLDLDLGLHLSGFVARPGIVGYDGSVQYRRASYTSPGEAETVRDGINYRANANLFNPQAPLEATIHMERSNDEFTPGAPGARGVRFDLQSLGSDIRYHQVGRPSLGLGYTQSNTVTRTPLLPDAKHDVQLVTADTSYGGPSFSYSARYAGTFSTGTYPADEYDTHRVDTNASAHLTERTTVRMNDSYYLRVPKTLTPFSPRQELNSFGAIVSTQLALPDFHQGMYVYSHGLQTVPGLPDLERTAHRLGYSIQRTVAPEWRLRGNLDANVALDRIDQVEERNAGQTAGLTALWQRAWPRWGRLDAYAGPSLGVIEPERGSALFGYGATAGAAVERNLARADLQGSYDLTYASDLGQRGKTLRQQARGAVQGPVSEAMLRGQLTVASQRNEGPVVGGGGLRSVELTGTATWRRYSASATGSVTSGVTSAVSNPGSGDGLFLGLPYDSHTYAASGAASAALTRRLLLTANGRFLSTDAPDRPGITEREWRGALTYAVGALRLQIEDRYVVTRVAAQSVRTNLLFVSAYRLFGSRY